jgi:hypothetical protein
MFTFVGERPAAAAEYLKAFCILHHPGYLVKACRRMAGHFLKRGFGPRHV